ncbi:MAG: cobalamin-dependent protein [Coriobacteriia bacterium]|nr:cobalamin-dependent protein [Coriobacteriia bacterium]
MATEDALRLYQAFVGQDPAEAIRVIESVRASGVTQAQLFDTLYVPAMALLGGAWANGEVDEFAFTQASVTAEQVGSFVVPPVGRQDTGVTVVVGVMQRDRHTVGKDIIAAALKESGYRVNDLGLDVRPADFLERIEETGARIVIVCAEMLAVAHSVVRVREMLTTAGHDDIVVLVAGSPFNAEPSLAREVGANGIVHGAESALRVLGKVVADLEGGEVR